MANENINTVMFGESSNTVHKKHMRASTNRKIANTLTYIILIFYYIFLFSPRPPFAK